MESLCDFPATIVRIKTLVDGGIRIEFDLPETQSIDIDRYNGSEQDFGNFIRDKSNEAEPIPIDETEAIADLTQRVSRLEKWARSIGYKS